MPIIYTPVVAMGCEQFSHIYRRPRGIFISYPMRTRIRTLLHNRPHSKIDVISNPTDRADARPDDLIEWTEGRALIATGSPFAPVSFGDRAIPIGQCNNVFIFPSVGLGVIASGARRITDGMMLAAARALGDNSPALRDANGSLLPAISEIRKVAIDVAVAVGTEAQRVGLAPLTDLPTLRDKVVASQWIPAYTWIKFNLPVVA